MTPLVKLSSINNHDLTILTQPLANRWVLVTDEIVDALHGPALAALLTKFNIPFIRIAIPAGESYKTRETKSWIEDQMLSQQIGRDSGIIALGGGVVTDLAGFVAATYCRGIPLISIPTTLMAMTDAALGGKTGVNTPDGKNMIGVFSHPKVILCDPHFLTTLPNQAIRYGLVESIKHALIADSSFFSYLESHRNKILSMNDDSLYYLIKKSIDIKHQHTTHDERDRGKRQLLNLGHTIGHAIEQVSGYQYTHGEAVSIGLVGECSIAKEMGLFSQAAFTRMTQLLDDFGLPTTLSKHSAFSDITAVMQAMKLDKKSIAQSPRCVLLSAIGHPYVKAGKHLHEIDLTLMSQVLTGLIHSNFAYPC